MSAFTTALNKISGQNQGRIVAAACNEIHLESTADAQLLVSEMYHRVVRDGSDCFHERYVQIFKGLHEEFPDFFEAEQFPTRWERCERLLSSLLQQEASHFLEGVLDHSQRQRCIAVAVMKLFGHLSIQGLCHPQRIILELLDDDRARSLYATCKRGPWLHHHLAPYIARSTRELLLHTECACAILEIIGPGLDVSDPRRFKASCVKQLVRLKSLSNAEGENALGTRGQILIQNLLEHKLAERRIDPYDGKLYTLQELLRFYGRRYTEEEIKHYFESRCTPPGVAAGRQQRDRRRRRDCLQRRHWA